MEQTTQQHLNTEKPEPRKPLMALALTLIAPGLGQVYNGQIWKAGVIFAIMLLSPLIFGLSRIDLTFNGTVLHILFEALLQLYILADAFIVARRQNNYVPKPYNTLPVYLLVAGVVLITQRFNKSSRISGIQAFTCPTPSGYPTVHMGDYLYGDTKAYENTEPDYGDIIIFTGADGQISSFRVVALPLDTFALENNIVSINNTLCKTTFIKDTMSERIVVNLIEEVLPNGHKHLMYRFKDTTMNQYGIINDTVIPANNYYVLGDNRDNALDSRFRGFVHRDSIKGRILYSYWGKTTKRINVDFRDR